MATRKTLTAQEEALARSLYEEFWRLHPNQPNPTDINTPEKEAFLKTKGADKMKLMQRARKQAYGFTRR
jgi:hypothetical protein